MRHSSPELHKAFAESSRGGILTVPQSHGGTPKQRKFVPLSPCSLLSPAGRSRAAAAEAGGGFAGERVSIAALSRNKKETPGESIGMIAQYSFVPSFNYEPKL